MSDLRAAERGGLLDAPPGRPPGLPAQFGPYEILGQLGAGGMGQVYRARDRRLQRNVALKILHDTSALDPDKRRRFAQEAIAASALNHPNILTVYDIGIEADTPYLVSELIGGTSLRSEMNQGRMSLRRLVDVALQIAEGLAAAHDAGIVHRDLKPENVMVTDDGRVKIVDFGLAKIHDGDSSDAGTPVSMTQTAEGLIVGTVPYMSPEQARGERADFRSDQFALGVVLYEMAAGAHPFKRDTSVQTLSAIIADDPPELPSTSSPLPTAVRWLIRRLLAKKPRDRYASTVDLATDLRNIREYLSEATSAVTTVAPMRRWKWQAPAAGAALLVGGLIAGRAAAPDDTAFHFDKFTPLATDAGYQSAPAWSPEGKQIAYEAEVDGVVQIFTRTLGSAMRTRVTDSAFDCYAPTWSRDGYIYYHSAARDQDGLWRVSPVGGEPQLVIENASESHISPDGKTVAFLRAKSKVGPNLQLWLASPPDGQPRRYTRGAFDKRGGSSSRVRFSPDGSKLMVWLGPDRTNQGGFWEVPLADGEPRPLLPGLGSSGQVPPKFSWLPDSRHLIVTRSDGPTTGTHLWLADTRTDRLLPITATPGNEGSPVVSPDGGTIGFTSEATDFDLVEVPLDGSPLRPFLSTTRNEFDPAASPVNTQYAFVTDRTGGQQIWLQNEEGYLQQALVTDAAFEGQGSSAVGSLAFSPDGRRLAFQRAGGSTEQGDLGGSRLWITSIAGGSPVRLGGTETYQDAPTWSPDGEWIAFLSGWQGGRLVKARVGGGTPVVLSPATIPWFVARPQWSPDGASILCETSDGLAVIAANGSGSRVVSSTGWLAYAWADDSRRAYGLRVTDDRHHFMLVTVDTQTSVERIINADLGSLPQALQPIRGFSRLRGRGFLTSIAHARSDIYLIEGFRGPQPWWRRPWFFGRGSNT